MKYKLQYYFHFAINPAFKLTKVAFVIRTSACFGDDEKGSKGERREREVASFDKLRTGRA